MAIAVGDALAIVAAQELHAHTSVSSTFSRNHPGGAIGASFRKPQKICEIATPICDIPSSFLASRGDLRGADILKAGYDSSTGWVRVGDLIASPSRIRRLDATNLTQHLGDLPWLCASRQEWVTISGDTRISQAAEWIRDMQSSPEDACDEHSILAVVEKENIIGVIEAGQLLSWRD